MGKILHSFLFFCLFVTIQCVVDQQKIYLHEPSQILIQPDIPLPDSAYFGYSLGYQKGRKSLVVGAPNTDYGKVYSCDLNNTQHKGNIPCMENKIDFATLANPTKIADNNQGFYTGASIAVTSNYFFTCAPLWTTTLYYFSNKNELVRHNDAYGTCFKIDDTADRYKGEVEKNIYKKPYPKYYIAERLRGGIGWVTLADEENNLLVVVKSSPGLDFTYADLSKSTITTSSVLFNKSPRINMVKKLQVSSDYTIQIYGLVAGNFFTNKRMYAATTENVNMFGTIVFFEYDRGKAMLVPKMKAGMKLKQPKLYTITYSFPGTMFGTSLEAAYLNSDDISDLIVGVPAYLDYECLECGAINIYLTNETEIVEPALQILGAEERSRFGAALSANDIDGDTIPEIIVSAIYANNGKGVLYIFSGHEIRNILDEGIKKQMSISDFQWVQKIEMESFTTFGFSLQFIADFEQKGYNELAVSSPGNNTVILLKCLQAINVVMEAKKIGEKDLKEEDTSFIIDVYATVTYPPNQENVTALLSITNKVEDERGVSQIVKGATYSLDISCVQSNCTKPGIFRQNVTVRTGDDKPNVFQFMTTARLSTSDIDNKKDFDPAWAVTSVQSDLSKTFTVDRPECAADTCRPRLNLTLTWVGHEYDDEQNLSYVVGSSLAESVLVVVENQGGSARKSCVFIDVKGAHAQAKSCSPVGQERYKCDLKRPLVRNEKQTLSLDLRLDNPTNQFNQLQINASLHEDCSEKTDFTLYPLKINYIHPTEDIALKGLSHSRDIAEKEILEIKENNDHIIEVYEYTIINSGNITWENIRADISMEKKTATQNLNVLSSSCEEHENSNTTITHTCTLNLKPRSTEKFTVSTEILISEIEKQDVLNTTSVLTLYLKPTSENITRSLTTSIVYTKEPWINKPWCIGLIAAIVALIILMICAFILYKFGFFKREEKSKLIEKQASVRRRSVKQSTRSHASKGDCEGLQMDVDEDPFDEIQSIQDSPSPTPETQKDSVILIQDTAQIHV